MKIAFVIDTISCDTAGTQKQLLEMTRRLDRAEFEPELICLWESPWMRENELPCPCTVLGYRGFLKANFPVVLHRFSKLISERRIDIVQTFFEDSIFVAWLATLFSHRRPILLSSRRDIGLGKQNQPWYHGLFRLALPLVNRRFDGIVANSEQVRAFVSRRERTSAEKIKVHYNGVALPNLRLAPELPGALALHHADVWIGIVANLTQVKRHDLLLRSFASLIRDGMPLRVRLLLLGDGPLRRRLEELAQQYGIRELVHFEGAVADVEAYLHHLDIGVLCSEREGLSNAILEYMAFGIPVVATNVGGNPELIDHSNGFLVAAGDADGLTNALRKLVSDDALRKRFGEASRTRVQDTFSWIRSMRDIENYYRDLIARRSYRGT